MKNPEQRARKRKKSEDPNCGQVVLKSSKRHCSDSGKKVRPKKLKCLAKGTSLDPPDPKKKQSDSESKKGARESSPVVIIDSSSDLELLGDTKKRKKVFKKKKNRKLFCIQVQNSDGPDEGQPGPTDLHASMKGNKTLLEVGRQDKKPAMKRKKKKNEKCKGKPACLELLHPGDCEGSVKQISGEPKASGQEMSSGQRKNRTVERKVVAEGVEKKKFDYYKGDPENVSKKGTASCKYKNAQSRDEPIQRKNNLARRSEKDSKAIKKTTKGKKLNKISPASFSCLAKAQENRSQTMSECHLKCGFEKEAKAPKKVNKAAKKQVKRKTGNANRCSEAGQDVVLKVGAPEGEEKRKKAKKRKMERDNRDGSEGSQEQQVKKKKRIKKETGNSQDGRIKVKKEKETKEQVTADEIQLVAFKKGNCDEVKIDKVRRQALQEEIDRESGKTKIAKEGLDNPLGQWSTAAFETPEEKNKFHRLMGGFKKPFPPPQSSPANANQPNMALDRPREQALQHNLEAEFKKALEFKHHRGIGLGFQSRAPAGIHIDKYTCKSIKFEA